MLYCYGNPFLAKSECVGTHLKLCSWRISSPSFTFNVILNVIHSLTAEPQGPHGSECQGSVMSCNLEHGCAALYALCWGKKHVQLYWPRNEIFCAHFLAKIFSDDANHFLLPFFFLLSSPSVFIYMAVSVDVPRQGPGMWCNIVWYHSTRQLSWRWNFGIFHQKPVWSSTGTTVKCKKYLILEAVAWSQFSEQPEQ